MMGADPCQAIHQDQVYAMTLEASRNQPRIFQCADPVLRQEIARSSGLSVNKEFINCCQDSCTRMRFARTHDGYELSNMEMDSVVLSSLALFCNFEQSLEEILRYEKLMSAKT
jgi:hypothetical protein